MWTNLHIGQLAQLHQNSGKKTNHETYQLLLFISQSSNAYGN